MVYTFAPQGVCSQQMIVEIDEQGIIQSFEAKGGCNGNLKGIAALLKGMSAKEAAERMKGIECGVKGTSCPDQIAKNLELILAQA